MFLQAIARDFFESREKIRLDFGDFCHNDFDRLFVLTVLDLHGLDLQLITNRCFGRAPFRGIGKQLVAFDIIGFKKT